LQSLDHRKAWRGARTLGVLVAGALALGAIPVAAETPSLPDPPAAIEINAQPVPAFDTRDPARRRFGLLEFRGGLVLTSPAKQLGGISAIRVAPDGQQFIAASDRGRWLRGRIVYEGTRPTGIANSEMAPMLGADGRPLAARGWYDTESIAQDGDTLYVGIERVHRIVRFNYGRDGLLARGQPLELPPAIRKLPSNKSIEALVFVPRKLPLGGTLIAISERGLDAAGNILGFLIGGPRPGTFTIKRRDDFDISDAAPLPDGDLLLLERKFSFAGGVGIRIRRIKLNDIGPGTLVDGTSVFDADLNYNLDNMEGLSVHRSATGETVLTLISDDNFSPLQRTLLLQFTLAEP